MLNNSFPKKRKDIEFEAGEEDFFEASESETEETAEGEEEISIPLDEDESGDVSFELSEVRDNGNLNLTVFTAQPISQMSKNLCCFAVVFILAKAKRIN